MKYEMKIVSARKEIAGAPSLHIDSYRWTEKPGPETEARAVYVDNEGFLVQMLCRESSPTAVHNEPDGPVHRDSCMEFFVNFDPEHDSRYINFEANANGNLHSKIGSGRKDRVLLKDLVNIMPECRGSIKKESWTLELFIPLKLVAEVYGRNSFAAGDVIKGNFYKCGDDTPDPHFGMWNPVDLPEPDFHRPEFFGSIELVR